MNPPDQRDRLRLALDGLRQDLLAIEVELVATRAVRANGGDDDEHDPDGIPLSSVLQLLEGQKMRAVNDIREAQASLVDLAHGTYGICRICSQPIPPGRLEIRPTTSTCVNCAG
ncbi:RNA polymerase-binding transcription factor DksA [Nakamurella sp. UYEF19]|uniref:TraR/DksA family transcriptional regulator n=1 Tax=Nakamurella sp. UYEF19 TaxID=1756392 RepID=UPI0033932005